MRGSRQSWSAPLSHRSACARDARVAQADPPVCPDGDLTAPGAALTCPGRRAPTLRATPSPYGLHPAAERGDHATARTYTPTPDSTASTRSPSRCTTPQRESASAAVRILVDTAPVCTQRRSLRAERSTLPALPDCSDADGDLISVFVVGGGARDEVKISGEQPFIYTPATGSLRSGHALLLGSRTLLSLRQSRRDAEYHGLAAGPAFAAAASPASAVLRRRPPRRTTTAPADRAQGRHQETAVSIALTTNEFSTADAHAPLDKATAKKLKLSRSVGKLTTPVKPGAC